MVDAESDYVLVRRYDLDRLRARVAGLNKRAVFIAAEHLVDNARPDDGAVDSAGDRLLGPDDSVRGLRAAFIDALADYFTGFNPDITAAAAAQRYVTAAAAAREYVASRDRDT